MSKVCESVWVPAGEPMPVTCPDGRRTSHSWGQHLARHLDRVARAGTQDHP